MNYAVVFNYSFDDDVAVYLFDDFEKACEFLLANMRDEHRIDTEENGWDSVLDVNEDCTYAKITTRFRDHEDVTEARLGRVYFAD